MDRLRSIAVDGVFASAEAALVGFDSNALRSLAKRGSIRRLFRGWWALQEAIEPTAPATDPNPYVAERRLHRLTSLAYLRHFGGRAVPSHHSALVLHGLAVHGCDLGTHHVTRTGDTASRRVGRLHIHGCTEYPLARNTEGQVTVGVAMAIVQSGITGRPESALVAADDALHQQRISVAELATAVDMCRHHPGIAPVRQLLQHAEGLHESPGETLTAVALRDLRLAVLPQAVIRTLGGSYRVDFLVRDLPLVIEFDGAVKYVTPAVLFDEKRREDHLRDAGFHVVRVTWSDLSQLDRFREKVTRGVVRARSHARARESAGFLT